MQTILDSGKTWFIHAIVYNDGLKIIVTEGFVSTESHDLQIGPATISGVHSIEPNTDSRSYMISFQNPIAWQCIQESYTCFDESEIKDEGIFISRIENSKYLSYIKANHGWFEDSVGKGIHYRVWTENEVIDIIACEEFKIEPFNIVKPKSFLQKIFNKK